MRMRSRSLYLTVAAAVVVAALLGSCSRTFSVREDAAEDPEAETTTTIGDESSVSTVPVGESTPTKPKSDSKTSTSKPSTTTPDDGFGGKPPSFPDFTFTATRGADGTVKIAGSGCKGGKVAVYPDLSGSDVEEGGGPLYANPNAAGEWSLSATLPAGTLEGTCFGVGTSGQSHTGGSHTVTIP